MKAVVQTKYGPPDLLEVKDVEKPTPRDNEVMVRIHASSVNFANLALVSGKPFLIRLMAGGLTVPKYPIPGGDVAGTVEAAGRNVTQFRPGDEVFGDLSDCGFGAFAEYVCAPENQLVHKPVNISFEEAAAVPQAALVALQGLRDVGHIRAGQKVLINGASGGNGTFAVQIAKLSGAEVTGVCSTGNLEMVRAIGADHVIDYTREDFANGVQRYDLILATAGNRSIFDYKRALSPGGTYVMAGGSMSQILQALLIGPIISMTGSRTLGGVSHRPDKEDLVYMKELIESGKVRPVIDRCYPLREAARALRYYGEGHSRGKVIITMEHEEKNRPEQQNGERKLP